MKELHSEAKRTLGNFDSWSIRHVKREQNADADRLVNEVLDGDSHG
jgi:ribonuclease HI